MNNYAQVADVQNSFPERDLVQLTDPEATIVIPNFIQTALDAAASVIDSYIESRFALPMLDPTPILKMACIDIAMYRMQSLRPLHDIEDARKRYEDAIKLLTGVNQGKITLGITSDTNLEAPIQNPTVLLQSLGAPTPQGPLSRRSLRVY